MYDSNPTLDSIKTIDEAKQGSVYLAAQEANDPTPG